jgi:hypothetical protein
MPTSFEKRDIILTHCILYVYIAIRLTIIYSTPFAAKGWRVIVYYFIRDTVALI